MAAEQSEICNIFCKYTSEFESYLLRETGSREEAAELAQDAYLRLVQLEGLDRIEQPRAYLFRSAVNLIRDRNRRRKVRAADLHVPIDNLEMADPAVPADEAFADKQTLNLFESAMYELEDRRRQAFLLHRFGEHSHAEIAQTMGISVSFVEKLIRAAVADLKLILGEHRQAA